VPVIGLVCGIGDGWRLNGGTYRSYAGAIERAGGKCVPLGPGRRHSLAECSGLFVPGGWDVHVKYLDRLPGDEKLTDEQVADKYKVETEKLRDAIEIRLIREALSAGMPYLGICRGFQVLNIIVGRKLIPDIRVWMPDAMVHYANDDGISESHEISITPGSIMEQCYGPGPVIVNSRHHQGITPEFVSDKLRVTAVAPDGVVEAVEGNDSQFIVGVQWHPERQKDAYINSISGPLFKAFVDACRERSRGN